MVTFNLNALVQCHHWLGNGKSNQPVNRWYSMPATAHCGTLPMLHAINPIWFLAHVHKVP